MKIRYTSACAAVMLVVGLVSTATTQGTSDPSRWADAIAAFDANAAARLGYGHAMIVSGDEGLDELSISGSSTSTCRSVRMAAAIASK